MSFIPDYDDVVHAPTNCAFELLFVCVCFFFFFFMSRGKAISVAVVANFTWNLLVTLVFPTELDILGSALTFGIFAVIDGYALYFIRSKVRLAGVSLTLF